MTSRRHPHPARNISWRETESSNVAAVGWDDKGRMYVRYKNGGVYMYEGVARQRVVACARSASVGRYVNLNIIPNYEAVKIS